MELEELEIIVMGLKALREKLALGNEVVTFKEQDNVVHILNIDFSCHVRRYITSSNVGSVANKFRTTDSKHPIMLIGKYISPSAMVDLSTNGISTLDCAGNCCIRYEKGKDIIINLTNKGEKNEYSKEKTYPTFQRAGLKVIFYLLQDSLNVNKTYREIQKATGISLGAINNVMETLTKRDFILLTNDKRILKNKKQLFNLWVENYNQNLKPNLLLRKVSFRNNDRRINWNSIELPNGMYWGNEAGASKIDNYLEPGLFDIYTDVPVAYLFRTGEVKEDKKGEIRIYQKFWKWETENHIAPLIILYADLMNSGNSRCLEIAERLLKHELKDYA